MGPQGPPGGRKLSWPSWIRRPPVTRENAGSSPAESASPIDTHGSTPKVPSPELPRKCRGGAEGGGAFGFCGPLLRGGGLFFTSRPQPESALRPRRWLSRRVSPRLLPRPPQPPAKAGRTSPRGASRPSFAASYAEKPRPGEGRGYTASSAYWSADLAPGVCYPRGCFFVSLRRWTWRHQRPGAFGTRIRP